MLVNTNLGLEMVKNLRFVAGHDTCLNKVGERMFSFLVNPESSLLGRNLLPFLSKMEKKHKMKETHLTTPFRGDQQRQFAGPAAVRISASRPSSDFKSSVFAWKAMAGWEDGGFWVR